MFWCIFDITGVSLLLGLAILACHAFYNAYINEAKEVLISINSIGEANIEAIIVGLAIVWGIVTFLRLIWRLI